MHHMLTNSEEVPEELTPAQIIENFLGTGIDPVMLERQYIDILLHYLRPVEDHRPSISHTQEVIDDCSIITDLIRQIADFNRARSR
jgi:hypothetical protein